MLRCLLNLSSSPPDSCAGQCRFRVGTTHSRLLSEGSFLLVCNDGVSSPLAVSNFLIRAAWCRRRWRYHHAAIITAAALIVAVAFFGRTIATRRRAPAAAPHVHGPESRFRLRHRVTRRLRRYRLLFVPARYYIVRTGSFTYTNGSAARNALCRIGPDGHARRTLHSRPLGDHRATGLRRARARPRPGMSPP